MIATWLLLALMVLATITDVQQQKIYNWTTYTGIVLALLLAGVATWMQRPELTIVGLTESLFGFAACGVLMLVCFVLFQIGGGDVKLFAMVGAFLGPALGIESILWAFVLGAALAVVVLIWKFGAVKLGSRIIQQLMLRLGAKQWDPLSEEEKAQLKMPLYLAPSALMAVVIVRFSIVNTLLGR